MKTTWKLTTLLLVAVSGLLTACGGGSGGETDSGVGSGGTGSNSTVTLTATVVQDTVCNTQVPATTAELVIYDNNWVIKSRHKPDNSGKITATIPKADYVNISLIGVGVENNSRRIDVDTFAQHPVGDIGVFKVYGGSTEGCECQTTDLTIKAGQWINYTPRLFGYDQSQAFMSYATMYPSYRYSGIRICRATGANWPTLYALTDTRESFSTAGYLADYDPAGPLEMNLDQFPTNYSANFDYAATSTNVMHNFGDAYISYSSSGSSSDILLFDNIPDLSAITLRAYHSQMDYYDGINVNMGRMQRKSVPAPYESTVEVVLPDSRSTVQLLTSMLNWLNSENNSYDLSGISDFETFTISLATTLTDGSTYYQSFYGPRRGTIPDEPLPTDYGVDDLLDENRISIYISMLRYGSRQTYQQYLMSNIAASRMTQTERLLGNRSEFNSIFVDINP